MRMRRQLQRHQFKGRVIIWDNEYPKGAPAQYNSPMGFKPFCFSAAAAQGKQLILWLDASILIKRPIEPLFELIARDGYLIFQENHSVGEYCADTALQPLEISREESFRIPSCWTCALGLDLADAKAREFLRRWGDLATDGVTFPGAKWSGERGWPQTVSLDPRVKGHRYDQTAASVLAHRLGMNKWFSKNFFRVFFENERSYIRPVDESFVRTWWMRGKLIFARRSKS